jgi:phage anti-repressor protein
VTASHQSTTSALIPVFPRSIGDDTIQTVNARDLHAFLGVKQRFNDWITKRIKQYGFIDGSDFTRYCEPSNTKINQAIDYFVSIEMAKQLAMVERNEKGQEARLYFLQCEKVAQQKQALPIVANPANQALIDTIVRLDVVEQAAAAAKQAARDAEERAARAENKADLLTQGQAWVTIHQFVVQHQLERQMPQSLQQEYARYLIGYCAQNNLRVYPQPVAYQRWQDENAYYIEAIRTTLPGWLNRRHGQQTLPGGESVTHDPGVVYVVGRRKEGRG